MRHRNGIATWGIGIVAAFVAPSTTAFAQLVKHAATNQPAAPQPLAVAFAQAASAGLGQAFSPDQMSEGLPATLVALIRADPDSGSDSAQIQWKIDKCRSLSAQFDASWNGYAARAQQVAAGVEQAKAASGSGDLAGARKILEGLITPVTLDDQGRFPQERPFLDPMDAELPALEALAELSSRLHDPFVLIDIATALRARRKVPDRESLGLMWLAGQYSDWNMLAFYVNGDDARDRVKAVLERASDDLDQYVRQGGEELSSSFLATLPKYGVHPITEAALGDRAAVKPGEWVLVRLYMGGQQFTGTTLSYRYRQVWDIPYNCKETDKIDTYDPFTGQVVYRKDCDTRQGLFEVDLQAKLVEPVPDWANHAVEVSIIGKVEGPGPKWRLAGAKVVDLRWDR